MLAPHIKKKVDKLWDRFWAAGISNPLVAVEQITYLLFLKRLEEIDQKRQEHGSRSVYAEHDQCKWSYIRQQKTDVKHIIEVVFPWLRQLEAQLSTANGEKTELKSLGNRMGDAYFQLDPAKGQVLSDAVDLIDQLFARAGEGSAAQDVMGDTFEYLLSEIASVGKNGQFCTPRHIIRFMIEMIDPQPGQRIIDPAAGTGGFLFSAQKYMMRKFTPEGNVRLEWDGAPHRIDGSAATKVQDDAMHKGELFVGLDNDRTMTRIGWMNLILHGLESPHIFQMDSLSKREGKKEFAKLAAPESYDVVFANPPFTGTVDANDIDGDSLRFPRGKKKDSKGNKQAVTDKSELLFCWLMLDLLDIGGRCAVIVPEGVLFGNTDAHVSLRRQLLTEHVVEAVISLPGGIFQPYAGVKTSVLVFRKQTKRDAKLEFKGQTPITEHVWFYEVADDGYSMDARRNDQPKAANDLWDALEKSKRWSNRSFIDPLTYYQPTRWDERWRLVQIRDSEDKLTPLGSAFPDNREVAAWDGKVAAIHELFPELPPDPNQATQQVRNQYSQRLKDMAIQYFVASAKPVWQKWHEEEEIDQEVEWKKSIKKAQDQFSRFCREAFEFFEKEDSPGLPLWKDVYAEANAEGLARYDEIIKNLTKEQFFRVEPLRNPQESINEVAKEFAKLDGFDVTLRSFAAVAQSESLKVAKDWTVPVRAFTRKDEWASSDGKLIGSHDKDGTVRPEYAQYVEELGLYDVEGKLREDLLEPDCIEAHGWSLSAGLYKPIDYAQLRSGKSITELISSLRENEMKVVHALDKLLSMVEGQE